MSTLEQKLEELAAQVKELTARVDALEKAKPAAAASSNEREYVVKTKYTSSSFYCLTSKDRILQAYKVASASYVEYGGKSNEECMKILKDTLAIEGDNMELPENYVDAIVKVYAKYRVDPTKPTLVGGKMITGDGDVLHVYESNKKIKF